MSTRACPGCKAAFPKVNEEGPILRTGFERYGVNSIECNAALNTLLNYEHSHDCFQKHSPQAYAVQHPPHLKIQQALGIDDRFIAASKQSVGVHLFALFLILEKSMPLAHVFTSMKQLLDTGIKLENEPLDPPANLGTITIVDVLNARSPEEHWQLIHAWNNSAWNAWADHHEKVRAWYLLIEK